MTSRLDDAVKTVIGFEVKFSLKAAFRVSCLVVAVSFKVEINGDALSNIS
jgi:hypothetical protein